MSCVSFTRIPRENLMKKAIYDSLRLIQCKLHKKIKNVVIKPNLCYYWDYSTGQTTDPKFVAAVVDLIRSQVSSNVNIFVVESDASAMKCRFAFKVLGYEKLAQKYGITLVNLTEDENETVRVVVEGKNFCFKLPRTIRNADLRVNIPKIKYSFGRIKFSCALKNIFGCNPYPKKFKYHSRLEEVIVALNKIMKFDLCIVDGNIVSGDQPRKLGLVMASLDPVAIDTVAAEIAGLNPKSIRYLKLAEKAGLGNTSFVPKGVDPGYFKARYPRKGVKSKTISIARNLVYIARVQNLLGIE